uniref:Uncharacterized protein n=1 Tax=Lygus hesperus TaxID=30085 RepID=A0A0A9WIA5_LYGHE
MAMEPLHPSLETPRRSASRRKDRQSIESYLKSKYPDSTFHHLKSVSDREKSVDSKPIADKSEDVKSNIVSDQNLQLVKRTRCVKPYGNYLKSKYPDATFHNLKIAESSDGEGSHDSRVKADKFKDVKRSSSPMDDSPGDAKNPESGIRQSSAVVDVDLKRKRGRPKKKNYLEFQNVESKSPIPTISSSLQVKSCANGKQSSGRADSSANFSVSGIFARKIVSLDDQDLVLNESVFRIPPVVKIDRLKCNLYDALEEHGFISASLVTMEMGRAPHLAPSKIRTECSGKQKVPSAGRTELENTSTKSLESDFISPSQELEQVSENYESMEETESKPFLGFDSPEKDISYMKCSTKLNHELADDKSSRVERNLSSSKEFSVRKDLGREYTVDARFNSSKRLEVQLHDFRLGKQFAKSKIVEESRSKSNMRPVVTSKKRSSSQSKKICSKTRTLNRSNYSLKKSQTKLNVAKNARKVDDVVEMIDSDKEQPCTNKIMLVQPIVMQQIFMPRIVMPPILMHNYTYQLPSQGLQRVSGQLNHRFTTSGVKSERSDDDEIISIVSSAENSESSDSDDDIMNLAHEMSNADRTQSFLGSYESENEKIVKSLIEDERKRVQNYVSSNPDCSELQGISYISGESKRVPPSIELEEYCYVSEDIKSQITSSGCDLARKGDLALTESAESNEEMEGIKKDQPQPCSSELSAEKPLLYEKREGSCDSLEIHNEVPNQEEKVIKRVSPVKSAEYLDTTTLSESAKTVEKLKGAGEDLHQPCSLELSVDKSILDGESPRSCSKSPVIISDIPYQEENEFCPIVNDSPVESSEHLDTTCPTEVAGRIKNMAGKKEDQLQRSIPDQEICFSSVANLTESTGRIEKLEGAKEDQHPPHLTESVDEPQLDEESLESSRESPVMHDDISNQEPSYSPVACHSESPNGNVAGQPESVGNIDKLVGTEEDQQEPCSTESVDKSQLDEGSMESYYESPVMHDDIPNQESSSSPVVCDSESPNENIDTAGLTESAGSIEKLVGTEEDQQEPCSTESVNKPQLDEESVESYCRSRVMHDDIPNQESSYSTIACDSEWPNAMPYAGSIANLEGAKELGSSALSVEKPPLNEESTDSCSESPVIHNDNHIQEKNGFRQIVSPADSAKHPDTITPTESSLGIQKLEGKKENTLQPCLSELSGEEAVLDSMETSNKSPEIHNNILNQDNRSYPVENEPLWPAYSVENIATLEESNDVIDKLEGTKKQQLLGEESMESSRRLSFFRDRFLNQNNSFSPVTNQSISSSAENQDNIVPIENTAPVEEVVYDIHPPSPSELTVVKPQLKEYGSESLSRLPLIVNDGPCIDNCLVDQSLTADKSEAFGETIECSSQSQPSVSDVSSEGSHESFKSSSSDHHDFTCEDDDGVNRSVSTLTYLGNVEEQGELGDCSLSEISSSESLDDSSYHDTMEEDIPSSNLEDLVEEYPLDEKRWDNPNKMPLEPSEPNRPDSMQVESQLVENLGALSGIVSETDSSNIMKILDKVNQDTSVKPLLCSSLGEIIQGAELIHEKPSLIISSDHTETPLYKAAVDSLNEATTDVGCISPELTRPSARSASNELCGLSFTQELDGIKCSFRENVTPETGVQNPLCQSVGKPSVDSESPPPSGSAYQLVSKATQHCSVSVETITPKGFSSANSLQIPLASFKEKRHITDRVNYNVPPPTPGKIGALMGASRSSMPTESGDILENTGQIDERFSCTNNTELQDQEKISVRTDTLILKNTFFECKSTPESNFNGQLSNKLSQENLTSDFLEMSDCTEAMVDACLRENLPGSSGDSLPSLQMVESANFPSVSDTSGVLRDAVRENGQLAETGVVANLPVEFAYESPKHFPTVNKASDLDVQSIQNSPNTDAELIFDGFFNETDEPIILPIEGDLNNDERDNPEDTQSQVLNATQLGDVNFTSGLSHTSSTIEIRKVGLSEKVSLVQPPPDVSLIAIPQTMQDVEQLSCERKQTVNNSSKICNRVNNLLFDEEFEQNENVTPVKRSRVEKKTLPDSPIPVGSKPSELLFDEEFETSNNLTPLKKIRVGPSVTISRVQSRRISELLFDEEFEQSNNLSPIETQKCGNIVRAPSPQAHRITSIGIVNELVIDENDEPPLNAPLGSKNCIDERPVSRNSSVGCVVISSDEECETPPLNNLPSPSNTNPAKLINRPTVYLKNQSKTCVNNGQIGGKSKPMATSSPRMVGKSKGRNPPLMRHSSLSPVFEDLSDTGSPTEPADSPPRKIRKISPCREETTDPLKPKGMVVCSNNLLGGGSEKIILNQVLLFSWLIAYPLNLMR